MAFETASNYADLKYFGDRSKPGKRVVHEIGSHKPECRLDEIEDSVRFVPDRLGEAHRYHYENCPHCLGYRRKE